MKQKAFTFIRIFLSVMVIISSVVYLVTQKMIPGLTPIALALLMLFIYFHEKDRGSKKWNNWFYLLVFLLNAVVGISQIIAAF